MQIESMQEAQSIRKIRKYIHHRDFASFYPTQLCSKKFPCGRWTACGRLRIPSDADMERYAYIMTLKFTNIKSHNFNTYIQNNKAKTKNPKLDNGRIISADELIITITEQDYITIRNNYDYDPPEVIEMYYCYKDYLPKELIEYCLKLYNDKTSLKNNPEMADQYALSKTYINSLYGMMVSAVLYSEVIYNPDTHEWTLADQLTSENINNKLEKLKNWSKYEKRYFLNFWWGVYICAYARRELWSCIESFPDEGYDVLYCDTDSIFYLGDHDFTWHDKHVDDELHAMCDYWGIDFELTRPKTPEGIPKPLGYFEDEDDKIIEFKTLGAKRYCFKSEDGELHLTVSGINKSAVSCLNGSLDNFHKGTNFDKDHPDVKKKLHTYVRKQGTIVWPDGYVSTEDYGINIRRTGYELTIPDEYERLMNAFSLDFDVMNDDIINIARRNFI